MFYDEVDLFNEHIDLADIDFSPAAMVSKGQMLQEAGVRDILARFTVCSNGVGLPATMIVAENGSGLIIIPRAATAFVCNDSQPVKTLYEDLRCENSKYRSRLDVSTLEHFGFKFVGID
jgi:hypothetical protein